MEGLEAAQGVDDAWVIEPGVTSLVPVDAAEGCTQAMDEEHLAEGLALREIWDAGVALQAVPSRETGVGR